NGGKVTLLFYDSRQTHTIGEFQPQSFLPDCDNKLVPPLLKAPDEPGCAIGNQYDESRRKGGELVSNPSAVFPASRTDDAPLLSSPGGRRHTLDLVGEQANVPPPGNREHRLSNHSVFRDMCSGYRW